MATLDLGNVMGPQGPQGEQGEVGPQGPQGPQGEQGPPVDTSTLIAKSEKGAANGVATLDSSGKLVQMPTATDVGITEMHQTITANERFNSVAVRVARIGNIVTITAPIISNYKKGEGGYPAMLTLPADYRPSTAVDILLPTTGSGDMANIMINNTSGNVTVGLLGSSDTVNLRINFSYVI